MTFINIAIAASVILCIGFALYGLYTFVDKIKKYID